VLNPRAWTEGGQRAGYNLGFRVVLPLLLSLPPISVSRRFSLRSISRCFLLGLPLSLRSYLAHFSPFTSPLAFRPFVFCPYIYPLPVFPLFRLPSHAPTPLHYLTPPSFPTPRARSLDTLPYVLSLSLLPLIILPLPSTLAPPATISPLSFPPPLCPFFFSLALSLRTLSPLHPKIPPFSCLVLAHLCFFPVPSLATCALYLLSRFDRFAFTPLIPPPNTPPLAPPFCFSCPYSVTEAISDARCHSQLWVGGVTMSTWPARSVMPMLEEIEGSTKGARAVAGSLCRFKWGIAGLGPVSAHRLDCGNAHARSRRPVGSCSGDSEPRPCRQRGAHPLIIYQPDESPFEVGGSSANVNYILRPEIRVSV